MQSQVRDDFVALRYMPSKFKLVDFLTKVQRILSQLSIVDPP